jgi:hypothetical protein
MIEFRMPFDRKPVSTDPVDTHPPPPVRTEDLCILMDTTFVDTIAMQYEPAGYPHKPLAFYEITAMEKHGDDCVVFVMNTGQRFRAVFTEIDPLNPDDGRRKKFIRLPKIGDE